MTGQLLGEGRQDSVLMTYTVALQSGEFQLHKLTSGAFQTGIGRDAKIITDISQVGMFGPDVQGEVGEWLSRQGAQRAMQEKVERDIHDASMSRPGDIDARLELAETVAPGIKGEIAQAIDRVLVRHGIIPNPGQLSGPGHSAGNKRPATQAEINDMIKSGVPVDPNNPPMVFDPAGDLAGDARSLQDAPDMTREMQEASERISSAMDLLQQEQSEALAMADSVDGEFEEEDLAGVGANGPSATPARPGGRKPIGRKSSRK